MIVLQNSKTVDARHPDDSTLYSVLVKDGKILKITDEFFSIKGAENIYLQGRAVMPGMIDCHVHVIERKSRR